MLWLDGMSKGTKHANLQDVVLRFRFTNSLFKRDVMVGRLQRSSCMIVRLSTRLWVMASEQLYLVT